MMACCLRSSDLRTSHAPQADAATAQAVNTAPAAKDGFHTIHATGITEVNPATAAIHFQDFIASPRLSTAIGYIHQIPVYHRLSGRFIPWMIILCAIYKKRSPGNDAERLLLYAA
jgi:hypothetical protein